MPDATPYFFTDDGSIPNNPTLPMLVYSAAVDTSASSDPAALFEQLFTQNGWTGGSWRNGIYPFPHYHSTAHEVLGIACGHQNLGASPDLLVVGAYPPGPDWDLCRGESGERPQSTANIASVPLPETDPVGGAAGPVVQHWLQR